MAEIKRFSTKKLYTIHYYNHDKSKVYTLEHIRGIKRKYNIQLPILMEECDFIPRYVKIIDEKTQDEISYALYLDYVKISDI